MNLPMVTYFMVKNFLVIIFPFVSSDSLLVSIDPIYGVKINDNPRVVWYEGWR